MKNLKFTGEQASVTLAAAVKAGEFVVAGGLIGCAITAGGIGDTISVALKGVVFAPKTTGVAIDQGAALFLAGDGTVGTESTGTTFVGTAHAAAASGDGTVDVLIGGLGLIPQESIAALAAPYTVVSASSNSMGDINTALSGNNTNLNAVAAKVNALIARLVSAGILVA